MPINVQPRALLQNPVRAHRIPLESITYHLPINLDQPPDDVSNLEQVDPVLIRDMMMRPWMLHALGNSSLSYRLQFLMMKMPSNDIVPAFLPILSDIAHLAEDVTNNIEIELMHMQKYEVRSTTFPITYVHLFDTQPNPDQTLLNYNPIDTCEAMEIEGSSNFAKKFVLPNNLNELLVDVLRDPIGEIYDDVLPPSKAKPWSPIIHNVVLTAYSFFDDSDPFVKSLGGLVIIVWNCRGVAHPSFHAILNDINRIHNPAMVILTETRVGEVRASFVCPSSPFDSHVAIDGGIFGGKLILWKGDILDVSYPVDHYSMVLTVKVMS